MIKNLYFNSSFGFEVGSNCYMLVIIHDNKIVKEIIVERSVSDVKKENA